MVVKEYTSKEHDFEELLHAIGRFGKYQRWFFGIMYVAGILQPIALLCNAILDDGNSDYTCTVDAIAKESVMKMCNDTWSAYQDNLTIPWNNETDEYNHCQKYILDPVLYPVDCSYWFPDVDNTSRAWEHGLNTTKCTRWSYSSKVFRSTVATKFDLVCDNSWKSQMSSLALMCGILVGAFVFGSSSDRFGRKPTFACALFLLVTTEFTSTFVGNYSVYCVLQLCVGAGFIGTAMVGYIAGMEILSERHRVVAGQFLHCTFSISLMLLALIGYLIPDWQVVGRITSAPLILFLLVFLKVAFESPRWLYAKNRHREAFNVLQTIAKTNGTEQKLQTLLTQEKENCTDTLQEKENEKKHAEPKYSMLDLFRNKTLLKITLILSYEWLASSCVFYGLSFSATLLGGNVFLNLFFTGLVEIPANLTMAYFMNIWGRRPIVSLFFILSGTALLFMMILPDDHWSKLVFFLIGKFGTSGAFSGIYLFSAELYPTAVRGNGMGFCGGCARLGGISAIPIIMLGSLWTALPYIVFGVIGVAAGVLVGLLPETKYRGFPESVDECETMYKHRDVSLKRQSYLMEDLDNAINQAGGIGLYQIVLVTVTSIFMTLVGANMTASIFEAMVPISRCKSPFESVVKEICPAEFQRHLVPDEDGVLSKCLRYDFSGENASLLSVLHAENSTYNCSSTVNATRWKLVDCTEWDYDRSVMRNTIVTDFNLVCGDQWAGYLSQSALMFGVGLGSALSGYVSDKIGRRNAFLITCIGATVSGTALTFVQSFTLYSAVRFAVGLFAYSPFPILFVLASELTTSKYRSVVLQVLELSFPFGFLYLSMTAFLLREWRHLQLVLSVPFTLGIFIWWFLPESPRWLCQKNREDEALKVVESMAKVNTATRTRSNSTKDIREMNGYKNPEVEEITHETRNSAPLYLKPNLRSASLKMFYNWFAVSCVYYGLTLNAAELDGDPFRNLCLVAVAEIIATVATIPLVNFCGRRATGCAAEIMAGLMCILVVTSPTGTLAMSLLGKFAISISFHTMYIHANEIYPTSVRNLGIGLCSAMARVGGIISPIIAMLGLLVVELPYVVFGILSILAGILVLTLPETRGVKLPQTIEDGEKLVSSDRGILPGIKKATRCH